MQRCGSSPTHRETETIDPFTEARGVSSKAQTYKARGSRDAWQASRLA